MDEDGAVIACGGIEAFPARVEAEFRWVMAAPSAQGRGLGRALMQESVQHLLARTPIRRILVYTTPGSAGFFRKLGFACETLRTEADYWTAGLHLELLVLRLEEG
jgi:N-acetylglutamate synthase-like GNAT family acetyltransferase